MPLSIRNVRVLSYLCLLCVCLAAATPACAKDGRVARVVDGDTLVLQSGETLRILGVDSPEMDLGGGVAGYFAKESKQALKDLVGGRDIHWKGARPDRYGRILARIDIPEGDVGEIMVRQGFAWYYPHADHPIGFGAEMLTAQREAMENGAGLWKGFIPWARKQGPVVGNRRSWRFFPARQVDAAGVSPVYQVRFANQEEAFLSGFVPARGYGLWPATSAMDPAR